VCLAAFNQNNQSIKYINDENIKPMIQKFNMIPFDDEVLSYIQTYPSIENSFNKDQKEWYENYCIKQLTKGCKE
jgi:ADP-dependent phosphofructokinase/glucokinase